MTIPLFQKKSVNAIKLSIRAVFTTALFWASGWLLRDLFIPLCLTIKCCVTFPTAIFPNLPFHATTVLSILPLSADGGGLAILGTELMNITTIPVSKARHAPMKNIIQVFAGLSITEIFQLSLLTHLPQALLKLSAGMGNIQSSLQKTMSLTAFARQALLLNRAK